MASLTVGISDLRISRNPEDTIITHSLGSCLGVTFYNPINLIGVMIHFMLPLSKLAPDKAKKTPAMFADTGITLALKTLYGKGVNKRNLIVKVAGGARLMDQKNIFNIGERNFSVFRKLMWKNDILISAQDVGGSMARTLRLDMETGQVTVKSAGKETELC